MTRRDPRGAMSDALAPHVAPCRPMAYRIRISGQLDARWAEWFEGLTIALDGDDTLITGPVVDQAALHGLLRRVRDLGMPLVSVCPVEPDPATTPGADEAGTSGVTPDVGADGSSTSPSLPTTTGDLG